MPQTCYARTPDGVFIAYQSIGEGPIDLVYVPGWITHLEVAWEHPLGVGTSRRSPGSGG
jgi:hypothetical protein